jgi:ribA/ribD-fused uncharacterized protein
MSKLNMSKEMVLSKSTKEIVFSMSSYSFLSNFYPSQITIDGKIYHHVEGYYQACKQRGIDDKSADYIAQFKDPSACKSVARSIPMTKGREKEWEDGMKIDVMRDALFEKFIQNEDLGRMLLWTNERELIEYAPWDEYWGTGKYGNGQNMLGKLLMEVRLNI